jgi:ABC-2 type transport system ATP-binding protein
VIEITSLTKRYGNRTAVNALSFRVERGDIFGFVGPNGAGKTTTIRMIAGLLRPSQGEISVGGFSVIQSSREVRRIIGYMPEEFGVYPDLKIWEYLDFFAACYRIPEPDRRPLLDDLLDLVELGHRRGDAVDRLSRGMKQRLSLARTLIHNPQVLILDEPASGLDPRARVEIRELLVELARMEKTIFFSSHILADVAEICTRVGIIEAGELVAVGGLEELHLRVLPRRQIEIDLLDSLEKAQELLTKQAEIRNLEVAFSQNESGRSHLRFEFTGNDHQLSAVLTTLVSNGISVLHFREDDRDLEEVFLHATKGIVT